MNKEQFLTELQERLSFLPASEAARFIGYYREMIDDRMEEGMSEEDAVADLGDIDHIVEDIQYDLPVTSLVASTVKETTAKTKAKAEKRWPTWGKVLAVLGIILSSPLWIALLLALACVIVTVLAIMIAVIVVVAALVLALAVASLASLVGGVLTVFGRPALGLALLGLGLLGGGLSVFAYLLAVIIIKGILQLIKLLFRWVKGLFVRKGAQTA